MIPLEARLLAGLDEFMLRLGHLKVLCAVAEENRGSWSRIARDAASLLARPVPIPENALGPVVRYLEMKRLCPVETASAPESGGRTDFRYPELLIKEDGPRVRLVAIGSDPVPRISWQDLCLAEPGVRSRVGAITATRGRASSKTGLSHICDWATALDLISSVGELTPEGRLLARLERWRTGEECSGNPYLLRSERIVFAYVLLSADIDVFARLAPKLIKRQGAVKKAEGTRLFGETVEEIVEEADKARYLTSGQQYRIAQHLRDLEGAVRRGGVKAGEIWSSSTAWHRTSSRLESYVDLGLLEKGVGGEGETYEYIYYPTEALRRSVSTLETAGSALEWIEEHLAACLFGPGEQIDALDAGELIHLVPHIAAALERPTAPLPINALSLGLVWLKAHSGGILSIGAGRRSIEQLARHHPGVARLSRGSSGERAEFVSFDPRGMGL